MLDSVGICPILGNMELEGGFNSIEEKQFAEVYHKEWNLALNMSGISEEERHARTQELGDIFVLSTPHRNDKDALEHVGARYLKRIRDGRNYYNIKPLHWTSSTVK